MNRKSFVFYKEWMEAISDLPDDIRLEIYESIIVYATTGNFQGLKPMAKVAFNFIKTDLDRDSEKYMSTTERNRINGKSGGRPRKNQENQENPDGFSKTQNNPENPVGYLETQGNPKNLDNDNGYDSDNTKKELSKESQKESGFLSAPSPLNPDYLKFQEWLVENAPYCYGKMKPLRESEFLKLKEKYGGVKIAEVISQIENRKDLRKRYTNLYRTILNWSKNDYGSK